MVLHTNGNGMNTEIAEEILKSGLFGSITFSVDAAGSDVYSVLRRGGDYERVKSQIEHFIKIRSGLGLQYPKVTLQFLVMKENCNHAEKFLEQWSSVFNEFDSDFEIRADDTPPIKGDAIFFKRLVTMKPEDQPQAESLHREICIKLGIIDEEVERSVNSDEFIPDHHGDNLLHGVDKRRPCIGLWQNLGIRYDGLVSACCRDFNASMAVGDLREQSLLSILNGQALLNMRKAHVEGRFSDIPVCNGCTGQPNGSISDEEIQDWLRYEGLN